MSTEDDTVVAGDIVTGVPAFKAAIQPLFKEEISERQVRYWIAKKILLVGRKGGLHFASVRDLRRQVVDLALGAK